MFQKNDYPLQDGTEWIYQEVHGPGQLYVKMEIVRHDGETTYFWLHYQDNDVPANKWKRLRAITGQGVFLVDAESQELIGPIYQFPLTEVSQWRYTALSTQQVRCHVLAVPVLETEAGVFTDCLQVESMFYFSGYSEAEWLAPGVGLVAYLERGESLETCFQLAYFRLGDGSIELGTRPAKTSASLKAGRPKEVLDPTMRLAR